VSTADVDEDGIVDAVEENLLRRFRPYYKFSLKKRPVLGDKAEKYRPTDANYQIRHAQLKSDHYFPGRQPEPHTISTCGTPPDHHLENPPDLLTCTGGSTDLMKAPHSTSYALNIANDQREGPSWEEAIRTAPGLYGHVVRHGRYYKIEYWQYFAYNDQDVAGDHEGDWCTVHVWYDPDIDDIVKTCHYVHSKRAAFDLRKGTAPHAGAGTIVEWRGPNYDSSPGDLHTNSGAYQNNTVRFYLDENMDKHVVCYLERNAHEMWPTQHGWWPTTNEFNGEGPSYLTAYDPTRPMNLGEVEHPLASEVEVILRFNGYWGYEHDAGNKPPRGPSLHGSWTWPDGSLIRPQIPDGDFEGGGEGPPDG
jgi:hypothetical protein